MFRLRLLELAERARLPGLWREFQFQDGSIKAGAAAFRAKANPCFNSKMVRLRPVGLGVPVIVFPWFQFQDGSIKADFHGH